MIKYKYNAQSDIPEELKTHYTENNGEWVLQVSGVKTQEDVDNVMNALQKERELHRNAQKKLEKYEGVDLEKWEAVKNLNPDEKDKEVQKKIEELESKWKEEVQNAKEEAGKAKAKADRYIVDSVLKGLLVGKGITNPIKLEDAMNRLHKEEIKVDAKGNVSIGILGDPADKFIETWAQSDIAKNYIVVNNSGGGAQNEGSSSGTVNNLLNSDKTPNITNIAKAMRDNPDKGRALMREAGLNPSDWGY